MISTRGNDASSTTREGLEITRAGEFTLTVEAKDGTAGNDEIRMVEFRHLALSFINFWVWGVNKVSHDTLIHSELGINVIKIYF